MSIPFFGYLNIYSRFNFDIIDILLDIWLDHGDLFGYPSLRLDVMDIQIDIYHDLESGYSKTILMDTFYIHGYLLRYPNGYLQILIFWNNIHGNLSIFLDIKMGIFASSQFWNKMLSCFGYSWRPWPVAAMRPPQLLCFAAHQPPFLDLSLCFQQWLASISRRLCQIEKKVFLKCSARRRGRTAAALPAGKQRCSHVY